jgi:TRAP-type mannitol/chloroaromatic compound transport system permease small subunit
MISRFVKTITTVNKKVGQVVSFLFIPIAIACFTEVVMRYVFNRPTIWAWDVATYLFCVLSVLGVGYTYIEEGHVRITLLIDYLSPQKKYMSEIIVGFMFIIVVIVLLYQTARMAISSVMMNERSSSYFDYPMYHLKIIIVIGIFLLLLQGIVKLYSACHNYMGARTSERTKKTK